MEETIAELIVVVQVLAVVVCWLFFVGFVVTVITLTDIAIDNDQEPGWVITLCSALWPVTVPATMVWVLLVRWRARENDKQK